MFAISLGADGAELCPLEPRHAAEFLEHMDRGRESIGQYIKVADAVTDLESSRTYLREYAEKATSDTGRIKGSGWTASWSAASCSERWTSHSASPKRAAGWSPRPRAVAWRPGPPA
ncbi:hypothetical protein ACIHDR_09900 [Nocardia sp. NPDC052278]|uniref:hypothetical protein n=1 Tax=unclassified Nocardia TaxID=2637762 RepID=UPI0036AFD92A